MQYDFIIKINREKKLSNVCRIKKIENNVEFYEHEKLVNLLSLTIRINFTHSLVV